MTAIEPGERAQAMLRIAEEAFTVGGYVKAQAAAAMATAYLHAAQLDLFERQYGRAMEPISLQFPEPLRPDDAAS